MPNEHCFGSLQVCALRVAKLVTSGAPDPGASNGYISDAIIQAGVSVELEEGDDFTMKNGCGAICQTFKDCDRVSAANISLELCQLDSELISLLLGTSVFDDSGDTIGTRLPAVEDACPAGTSLEVWSKAWDGTEQAVPTTTSPDVAYWHWVFPRVKWSLGDFTLENDFATISAEGIGEENDTLTVDGPYNDWPAAVAAGGGVPTVMGWFLESTLPTAVCGFTTVPATS